MCSCKVTGDEDDHAVLWPGVRNRHVSIRAPEPSESLDEAPDGESGRDPFENGMLNDIEKVHVSIEPEMGNVMSLSLKFDGNYLC